MFCDILLDIYAFGFFSLVLILQIIFPHYSKTLYTLTRVKEDTEVLVACII